MISLKKKKNLKFKILNSKIIKQINLSRTYRNLKIFPYQLINNFLIFQVNRKFSRFS